MTDEYLKEFQARRATLNDYDANIVGLVPCLIEETVEETFETIIDLATEKESQGVCFEMGSATSLLIGVDQTWCRRMKNQMQQNMAMGANNYPKSVDETVNTLNTFAKISKTMFGKENNFKSERTEVAFAQTRDLSKVTCYHCRKKDIMQKHVSRRKSNRSMFIPK